MSDLGCERLSRGAPWAGTHSPVWCLCSVVPSARSCFLCPLSNRRPSPQLLPLNPVFSTPESAPRGPSSMSPLPAGFMGAPGAMMVGPRGAGQPRRKRNGAKVRGPEKMGGGVLTEVLKPRARPRLGSPDVKTQPGCCAPRPCPVPRHQRHQHECLWPSRAHRPARAPSLAVPPTLGQQRLGLAPLSLEALHRLQV